MNEVYVIYDPLHEEVLCVHNDPNMECEICQPIREDRNNEMNKWYQLEEYKHEIKLNTKKE